MEMHRPERTSQKAGADDVASTSPNDPPARRKTSLCRPTALVSASSSEGFDPAQLDRIRTKLGDLNTFFLLSKVPKKVT